MAKPSLNKYEKKIMLSLKLIRVLCGIAIALNLILPIVDNPKFTLFLISQLIAIGAIYVYALVNVVGNQGVPIVATFFVRTLQALIFMVWRHDVSLVTMLVFIFLDILTMILLAIDKGNYEYVYVKASEDEFGDTF